MANVEGVGAALIEWGQTVDPESRCALVLTPVEVGILHLALEHVQAGLELAEGASAEIPGLEAVRGKIERLLVQAGYGGDPRT